MKKPSRQSISKLKVLFNFSKMGEDNGRQERAEVQDKYSEFS